MSGDLGVSPGTAITGFPPGTYGGSLNAGNAVAAQAQSDVTTAYDNLVGLAPTTDEDFTGDLVGRTLVGGVYSSSSSMSLSGTLTLDGQGDPDSVFVFQAGSSLTTGSASSVSLVNGAQACNVYWQVGSSATLGTGTSFVGSILALTSISVTSGTQVQGRALARNGSVTLDNNVFTDASCATGSAPLPTTTPPVEPTEEPTDEPTGEPTVDPTDTPTETPTDEPTVDPTDTPTGEPTADATDTPTGTPTGEQTDEPTDAPTGSATDTPADTDALDESDGSDAPDGSDGSEEPNESASPTSSDAPSGTPSASTGDSDSPIDSGTPDDSDGPEQSDAPREDSSESDAAASADDARAASDSGDLPSTGPGALLTALIAMSALLIIAGSALLITKRHRTGSSD
ncbi:hypothetical protein GCM10009672_09420 [Nesterenkonia lutea]